MMSQQLASRRVNASLLCLVLILNALAAECSLALEQQPIESESEVPENEGAAIEAVEEGGQHQLIRAKRLSKTLKYAIGGALAGAVLYKIHKAYSKSHEKKQQQAGEEGESVSGSASAKSSGTSGGKARTSNEDSESS